MQMGGPPGGPATLPRANGAKDAARHLGAELVEQYSGWLPDVMVQQFREAMAASPDCIVIMGHPGGDAFQDLVDEAQEAGIRVTVNNTPLSALQQQYGGNGMGYAGVILYDGGYLTAQQMVAEGNLQAGDKALVYGLLGQAERGESTRGLKEGLEEAGVVVDYLEISPEVNNDTSLAVPILVSYFESNPDVKAFGTQHGGVTGQIRRVMEQAGKEPGDIVVGGIDLAPSTIDGLDRRLHHRLPRPAALPPGLPPRHPMRPLRSLRLRRPHHQHRRRNRHPGHDRRADPAYRGGDSRRKKDEGELSSPSTPSAFFGFVEDLLSLVGSLPTID